MKRFNLLKIVFLFATLPYAALAKTINFNTTSETNLIVSDKAWKYCAGDDTLWKNPDYNDSGWDTLATDFSFEKAESKFTGIGWFRYHLKIDSSYFNKSIAIIIEHMGASEIYLNGKLVHSFGKPGKTIEKEQPYNPHNRPVSIVFDTSVSYVIAVRYSNQRFLENKNNYGHEEPGFDIALTEMKNAVREYTLGIMLISVFLLLAGIFIALFVLNIVLFFFYRDEKANLYYSIFTASLAITFLVLYLSSVIHNPKYIFYSERLQDIMQAINLIASLALVYSIIYERMPVMFRIASGIIIVYLLLLFLNFSIAEIVGILLLTGGLIEIIRVIIKNFIKKYDPAKKIRKRFLYSILIILGVAGIGAFIDSVIPIVIFVAIAVIIILLISGGMFIIPIYMTFRHARKFSDTTKSLELQLVQVKELSARTLEQEQEKKKILETQKDMLEVQVAERTAEVVKQKREIEEKNKDITDSINYARRIQDAMLPASEAFNQLLPESFVLYKPKDIVSGDFYWIEASTPLSLTKTTPSPPLKGGVAHRDEVVLIAAADCTGHGVPGAFMSMIGHNLLNKIVIEKGINKPSEVLSQLSSEIRTALKQRGENSESRDGMDIALISLELAVNSSELKKEETKNTKLKTIKLQYAGAQRPLWIIKDETLLTEIKADKFSIGGLQTHSTGFTNHEFDLKKGDTIYLFSDGYTDQFGGEQGKKFMSKRLKELLVSIQHMNMPEQKNHLNKIIEEWKAPVNTNKNYEQVDDILVIGIRI